MQVSISLEPAFLWGFFIKKTTFGKKWKGKKVTKFVNIGNIGKGNY